MVNDCTSRLIIAGENATGRKPNIRYSSLADKMCEKGWFGQKTQKGWYNYDPSAPRKPLENPDALLLIEDHRNESVCSLLQPIFKII